MPSSIFGEATSSLLDEEYFICATPSSPQSLICVKGFDEMPCLPDMGVNDSWNIASQFEQHDVPSILFSLALPSLFSSEASTEGTAMSPMSTLTSSYAAASIPEPHHDNSMSMGFECEYSSQNYEWALPFNNVPLSVSALSSHGISNVATAKPDTPLHVPSRRKSPSLLHEPAASLKARITHTKKSSQSTKRSIRCRADQDSVKFHVESSTTAIDDGYVWLKYGQKNIKDKNHPRGYLRCAHEKCFVKKQVEACSEEEGFVSITYFGKHNHNKPTTTTTHS